MFRITTEEFGELVTDVMRKKQHDLSHAWHPEDVAIAYSEACDIVGYTLASLIEKGYLTNEK